MSPLDAWLEGAQRDAERRLPSLRPLLDALSRSTAVLRDADWNADATDRPERSPGHDR